MGQPKPSAQESLEPAVDVKAEGLPAILEQAQLGQRAHYIAEMLGQLRRLASGRQLQVLRYLLAMAIEEAELHAPK